MQNVVYQCKEEYYKKGKCLKRERAVGVPWTIVALVSLFMGKTLVSIPPSFWDLFKR